MIISLGRRHNTYLVNNDIITNSGASYEIGEQISRGGNATVHECISSDGSIFAIKFMLQLTPKMINRFEQEIRALKEIEHPHIIKYVDDGWVVLENSLRETKEIRLLIMEKADGNLLDYMKKHEKIGYETYAPQFRGLSEALGRLHNYAIHRDIKPENILVKGETWLISDLGLCSYSDESEHLDLTTDNEKIGPKYWLSPEAVNKFYFNTEAIREYSDVYQLCAVFWFIVTYRHPTGILCLDDWKNNDQNLFDVIKNSLAHDYSKRPQNGNELFRFISKATTG